MSNEVQEIAGFKFKDAQARENIGALEESLAETNAKLNDLSSYDIVVDKNGNGDYTTLMQAVQNATNGQTIFVRKGTYDNEVVNCVGKYLIIVGEDKKETIIQNSYDDYSRPPLNIGKGIIKNLTLKQTGSSTTTTIKSYAVHIDNNDLTNNVLHFINCDFYSLTHASIGVGLRPNCNLIFTDCYLRSDHLQTPQGEHRGALFVHNSADQNNAGDNQNLTLDNCKLETKYGSVLHLEHCLGADNKAYIIAYNTNLYSDELGNKPGLISQELNSSASAYNIELSNKNGGNNYPTLNASEYQVGSGVANVIGKFKGNGVEKELKRIVFDAPVEQAMVDYTIDIRGIYNIEKVVNVSGILYSNDTFIPINSSGNGTGENITVYGDHNIIHYRAYAPGTLTVILDYV